MTSVRYLKDEQAIVHLVFDRPDSSANTMDARFRNDFKAAIHRLAAEVDSVNGVILRSKKSTFFAGGDLNELIAVDKPRADTFYQDTLEFKTAMRTLETLGKPVVSLINGAAMGGGWELCLSSHWRIALDEPAVKVALPEVNLGLMPGAGGVVRSVRLLGLEKALPLLQEGTTLSARRACDMGLIHQLASSPEQLTTLAISWIQQHPEAVQPWDQKGFQLPGGTANSPAMAAKLMVAPALLRKKTHGCYPALEAILSAASESTLVDIDSALRIESRYFTELVTGQIAKNMIQARWFHRNDVKALQPSTDSNSIEGFKTRLLTAYKDQAVAMREEGIPLAAINNGAALAGFSPSPLIRTEDADLNPNLTNSNVPFQIQDIKDRLLFILAIEAVHSLEEGEPAHVCEANIYSLQKAGYPAWTGGALQFINQYGLPAFTARARELAQQFGPRFSPPERLVKMAENRLIFRDGFSA